MASVSSHTHKNYTCAECGKTHKKIKTPFTSEDSCWRKTMSVLNVGRPSEVRVDYSSEDSYCKETSWKYYPWEIFSYRITSSSAVVNLYSRKTSM